MKEKEKKEKEKWKEKEEIDRRKREREKFSHVSRAFKPIYPLVADIGGCTPCTCAYACIHPLSSSRV